MAETSLTLFVELRQGARIDMESAAQAQLAWVKLIRDIGGRIDPLANWQVELESALPGSQRFRSFISLSGDRETRVAIISAITTSIFFVVKEAAAWGVGEVMNYIQGPDAPEEAHALSDEDKRDVAEEVVRLLHARSATSRVGQVYEALEQDINVTGAGATSNREGRPSTVVSRDDFPSARDDMVEEEKPEQRITSERIELTLIRPILANDSSRRWGFQSSYGNFGAPIRDQEFLKRLARGQLNVPLVEGIQMVVDIDITEEREGQLWRPVERVITRVVEVNPPPQQDSFELDTPE